MWWLPVFSPVCVACCIWLSTTNHQAWRTSDSELHWVPECSIETRTARTEGRRSAWWCTTATAAATAASMYQFLFVSWVVYLFVVLSCLISTSDLAWVLVKLFFGGLCWFFLFACKTYFWSPDFSMLNLIVQMIQRGGNRNFRYTPNARNTPDATVPPQGIMGAMLPVPIEIGPVTNADSGNNQPLPISALASALASAPPEQQRAVCFLTSLLLLKRRFF